MQTTYEDREYIVDAVDFANSANSPIIEWKHYGAHHNARGADCARSRLISISEYLQARYQVMVPEQRHPCVLICHPAKSYEAKQRGREEERQEEEEEGDEEGDEEEGRGERETQIGKHKEAKLVPEECVFVGIPRERLQDQMFMAGVYGHTRHSPAERMKRVSVLPKWLY